MNGKLLSEYDTPTKEHYYILLMSWAGWVFDFYDLTLYTFLLIPIGKELHLSNMHLSYILGISLAATAIGGIIFRTARGSLRQKKRFAMDNTYLQYWNILERSFS